MTKSRKFRKKVRCQEAENWHLQQQIEELQQKEEDSKKTHKLEITKVYSTLTSNTKEIYWLRNHNKLLVKNINKLKSTKKAENSNEYIEGKVLEKQEENQCLLNINQELEKEIKKLKEDKKSQDERFEKIQSKKNLLENKIAQIQRETKSSQGSEGSPHRS